MNRNRDSEKLTNTDPDVSAAYRAIADEIVPPRLDDIVLQQAAWESRPLNKLAKYFYSVRRPLAFAATLVLSLGVALHFADAVMGTKSDSANGVAEPAATNTTAGGISATVGGAEAMGPEAVRLCDETKTASAELWWNCIVDLEREGRAAASASERKLLVIAYPDFTPPK